MGKRGTMRLTGAEFHTGKPLGLRGGEPELDPWGNPLGETRAVLRKRMWVRWGNPEQCLGTPLGNPLAA